jgi:hypothetical protein
MFKLLIDTCTWLDLAKDPNHHSLLSVIEELIKLDELSLIVPRTILDEFHRHKARIADESRRSLSGVFKRVKEAVDKFGDPTKKRMVLEQLNDVDHRIPILGESAISAITRIEALLTCSALIEPSDHVKLRAAQRAIDRRAPFHRSKNSIDDAIIIETYADCIRDKASTGVRFAFVTHNTKDFSDPQGSDKIPHPDLAMYFSKIKSLYFVSIAEAVHRFRPALVTDLMLEHEWVQEPRSLTEILQSEGELTDKVWYNRHQYRKHLIENGKIKIVEKEVFPIRDHKKRPIQRDIWEGAKNSAERLERIYGPENLGPWDDFEWGMINGKLSALRWVMGEEWDELYT